MPCRLTSSHCLIKLISHPVTGITVCALVAIASALPSMAQMPLGGRGGLSCTEVGTVQQEDAYTLGAGDRIQIDIFNVPEYSGENGRYQVLVDGTLNLPLVGRVSVQGMTLAQAAAQISARYEPFIQRADLLTVSLIERRPLQVGVSGEVIRPGSYTISLIGRGDTQEGTQLPTVTRAIELAGGVTQAADIRQIQVRRPQIFGGEQLIAVDLSELLQTGCLPQNITLRDGDTIYVPTATSFNPVEVRQLASASFAGDPTAPVNISVLGEVARPGPYTVTRIDEKGGGLLTVSRALQTAGGITLSADIRQIQLLRRPKAGDEQIIPVNLWEMLAGDLNQDLILQQGDTIYVPTATSFNAAVARQLASASFAGDPTQPVNISVLGEVSRPGSYTVTRIDEKGGGLLTVTRALQTAGGITLSADIQQIQVRRRPKAGEEQIIPVNFRQMLAGDLSQDVILQQGDTIYVPTATTFNAAVARQIASASFAEDLTQPVNIAVSGEVGRPGSYTVTKVDDKGGLLTVTRALQTAGGITLSADIRQIQVRRLTKNGSEQRIDVNLWEMLQGRDLSQDVILQQGDTIFVPTATTFNPAEVTQLAGASFAGDPTQPVNIAVAGEVTRPGSYTVTRVDEKTGGILTVTRAIQTAGGIRPSADIRQIQVLRRTKVGSEQRIDVNLWELLEGGDLRQDAILQQGDRIVVPTATNIDLAEAPQLAAASFSPTAIRVNIVGEVVKPGVVELPPNSSLNQALLVAGGFNNQRADKTEVELIRLNPNGTVSRESVRVDFAQGLDEETNPPLRNNDVIVVDRSGFAKTADRLGPISGAINAVVSPILSVFGFLRIFNTF